MELKATGYLRDEGEAVGTLVIVDNNVYRPGVIVQVTQPRQRIESRNFDGTIVSVWYREGRYKVRWVDGKMSEVQHDSLSSWDVFYTQMQDAYGKIESARSKLGLLQHRIQEQKK